MAYKVHTYSEGLKKVGEYNLITLVGEETFFREQVKNKKVSLENNLNITRLDASEIEEEDIFLEIKSKDLFSSKKIFLITNFTKIKNLDFFSTNSFEDIIILDSEKPSKSKSFKSLEEKSLYIDCSIKPWDKENFALSAIKNFVSRNGYTINEETATYLYSNIGFDLYKIISEIQKIILYKNDNSLINVEDVNAVCILNKSYNIFDIVDRILENKKKEALEIMEKVFFYETSPALLLISLWYNHFENLLYLKNTEKEENQLTSYIKMSPTVIKKKLMPQAKKISNKKILESVNILADLDVKLRKGSFNLKFYLEKFILNF